MNDKTLIQSMDTLWRQFVNGAIRNGATVEINQTVKTTNVTIKNGRVIEQTENCIDCGRDVDMMRGEQ